MSDPTLDSIVAAYRPLREALVRLHAELLTKVPPDALAVSIGRLGLAQRGAKEVRVDSSATPALAEYCLYSWRNGAGRTCVDTLLDAVPGDGSPADSALRAAMRRARMAVLRVVETEGDASLRVDDLFARRKTRLIDFGLRKSLPVDALFAARLLDFDGWSMTSGLIHVVTPPVYRDAVELASRVPEHSDRIAPALEESFSAQIVREALALAKRSLQSAPPRDAR